MLNNKTIAVVVPAYNEESQIGMVIDNMPDFVDRIVIVNDKSTDNTAAVVEKYIAQDQKKTIKIANPSYQLTPTLYNEAEMVLEKMNQNELDLFVPSKVHNTNEETDRIILINHLENGGVGAGIARGYKWCKDRKIDCTAVMAGDGQMDPSELEMICLPVLNEGIDYVKGNRLRHPSAKYVIPRVRLFGNSVLSILTKLASGYWRVSDTQTGYTAISLSALNAVKIHKIYRSYGMPNDLLVKLNINGCSLKEVTIKPVYRVGEQSKMKVGRVIRRVSILLIKLFFERMWVKYFLRDFHPLFLFYHMGIFLGLLSLPYLTKIVAAFINGSVLSYEPILAFLFLSIASFQAFIFGMWMDIQDNDRLHK